MYEIEFAERLSSLREQKGVSARKMSLDIGQNETYVNQIESKRVFPSMQLFFYICEYLNITPMEFFNFNIKSPEKLNNLIPQLEKLSQSQLETISSLVKEFTSK